MAAALETIDLAKLVYKAKLAEQAERFDEMKNFMKEVATTKRCLTEEERRLLSVAYKNYAIQQRTAWRCADAARSKYAERDEARAETAATYAKELATKVTDVCAEVERLLSSVLLPSASNDAAAEAFYQKMDADYKRYRAEVDVSQMKKAMDAYARARTLAKNLPPNDSVRLGIALNYAVFQYELQKDVQSAIDTVRSTLADCDESIPEVEQRDAYLAYQLLKDNLDLWCSETKTREPIPC